ncbi:Ig-like domain-containing protein [Curtobacterium sp. RRHDQ66]|uniref:Ig-like domain-containing protein n=1 Tax=Curtobacterium guangdongense TaxID=3413380 RepID=UPI003BEF9EE8
MLRGRATTAGRGRLGAVLASVALAAVGVVALTGGPAPAARAANGTQTVGTARVGTATVATADAGAASASDPVRVAVPYTGKADVALGDGWTVADCGRVNVPTGVAMACSGDSLSLTSKGYRTDFGTVLMTVPLRSASFDLDVTYLVSLAPPTAPTLDGQTYDYPFAAGTTASIPWSDLGVRCDGCAAGPRMTVVSTKPAGFVATVTSTGLLVRGPEDRTGTATVRLRATDDQGHSGTAKVKAVFVAQGKSGIAADDVVGRLGADGSVTIDLHDLADSTKGTVTIDGCGTPVAGTVTCADDGTATYRPDGTMRAADQFSFHVRTASGDQATGTVTVLPREGTRTDATASGTVATDDDRGVRYPATGLQADTGAATAHSVVRTLPSEDDTAAGGGSTGLLTPLTAPLDRITNGNR